MCVFIVEYVEIIKVLIFSLCGFVMQVGGKEKIVLLGRLRISIVERGGVLYFLGILFFFMNFE